MSKFFFVKNYIEACGYRSLIWGPGFGSTPYRSEYYVINDVMHSVVGDVPVDNEAPVVTLSISRIWRFSLQKCS